MTLETGNNGDVSKKSKKRRDQVTLLKDFSFETPTTATTANTMQKTNSGGSNNSGIGSANLSQMDNLKVDEQETSELELLKRQMEQLQMENQLPEHIKRLGKFRRNSPGKDKTITTEDCDK